MKSYQREIDHPALSRLRAHEAVLLGRSCQQIVGGRTRPGPSAGVILLTLFIMAMTLALVACQPVSTPPVAKVGLIAPFEGPSRPLGYATLNAVRLRLNQWNEAGGLPRLELVALNDDSDPTLASQLVSQLAHDPGILFVLAPPQGHTALAAAPVLIDSGLPAINLAPLPVALAENIVPFAGTDLSLESALAPFIAGGNPAWDKKPHHRSSGWAIR